MTEMLVLVGFALLYFIPSIYAHHAKKRNAQAITLLNLFLGWTVVGWLVALVWAATKESALAVSPDPGAGPTVKIPAKRDGRLIALAVLVVGAMAAIYVQRHDRSSHINSASYPKTPGTAGWEASSGNSAMDGSPIVAISLKAESRVSSWLDSQRPELFVRCMEHSTSLILDGKVQYSVEGGDDLEAHSVRLRFDDSAPHTEQWRESSAGTALFSSSPLPEIKRLEHSKILRVEYTPFNSDPVIATFDVSGLDAQIAPLRKACKW